MRYCVPKRFKLAVLYARDDPRISDFLNAERQETLCREYCESNKIAVLRSVRVRCDSATSLELMKTLLLTLPPEVDTLLAVRFSDYCTYLPDLGRLCLMFQCRQIFVQTLDNPGPLYRYLHCLRVEDFDLADARYEALKQQK